MPTDRKKIEEYLRENLPAFAIPSDIIMKEIVEVIETLLAQEREELLEYICRETHKRNFSGDLRERGNHMNEIVNEELVKLKANNNGNETKG